MKSILLWAILVNGPSISSNTVESPEIWRSRPDSGHGLDVRRSRPGSGHGLDIRRTRFGSGRRLNIRRSRSGSGRRLDIRRSRPGSGHGVDIRRSRPGSGHGVGIRRSRPGSGHGVDIRRSRPGSGHGVGIRSSTSGSGYGARREYESDFESFMKKMFSDMPQSMVKGRPVDEEKRGANLGYRPYWYGYNFANDRLNPKQTMKQESSHEEWDYGMGRGSGRGVWSGGLKALLAGENNVLGAGSLVGRDMSAEHSQRGTNGSCPPNLGPACQLGSAPDLYDDHTLKKLIGRTRACNKCSPKSKQIGLVCTMDKFEVFQEMDMCVMDKMNCLGGEAGFYTYGDSSFGELPFAVKPGWARVSIRGAESACIRLYDTWPYQPVHSYYMILNGRWDNQKYMAYLWQDDKLQRRIDNPYALGGGRVWTEYTIVWSPSWFLLSQARKPDWEARFHLQHWSAFSWEIKYLDAASHLNIHLTWILHDLPYDLIVVNEGKCQPPKQRNNIPADTAELLERTRDVERAYRERVQWAGVRPERWSAEDGPYIEYPQGFFDNPSHQT